MKSTILSLSLCLLFGACSNFQRSQQIDVTKVDPMAYLNGKELHDLEESRYELGMNHNRSLSQGEVAALQRRLHLKSLERNLESNLEKNLYFKNKAFFSSDNERIEFLNISDYADKMKWLDRKNFTARLSQHSNDVEEAIQQNDILLHMSMNAVRESWGEPEEREVSGNELYGNERWTYSHYYSSQEGYKRQERVIFFEHGKVVAWRTL